MKVNFGDLQRKLDKGDAPRISAIVGNEDFLKNEAVQRLLGKIHGGKPHEEDCLRIVADRNVSPEHLTRLFDDLRTPSLFGGDCSIVLEGAERYLAVDRDAWVRFLGDGFGGATLILVMDELDGRTKVAKVIESSGWLIKVEKPFHRPPPWKPGAPPWDNPLNQWIVERATAAGFRLDPKGAHLLQCRVGTSLGDLAGTVERLATVLGDGGVATPELVEKHTPDGEESNLFELVDVFFLGDRRRTLSLVKEILHRGSVDRRGVRVSEPSSLLLQFVGAALRRARQLREIHRVLATGGDEAEIMAAAGVSRPFLPQLRAQARATPPTHLPSLVAEFRRADRDLKTGRGPRADELMERLACMAPA